MDTHERAALALADSEVAAVTGEQLLSSAIAAGANVIHLEPAEELARVRYRIDGLLQEMGQLSHAALATLVAHFKHRASLQPDEHRWAQEGNFDATIGGKRYTVALSTLPLTHGEKAVIRVFATQQKVHDFASLGLWGETRRRLSKAITAHDGVVIISGTHHAGTSTTLNSILHIVKHPTASIASIETHPSKRIEGVQQIRVHERAGITPSHALQATLKSDANIIMLDDLHGRRVTDHVLEAASKGRLVVAGMHSSNLLRAMTQLSELTSEPFMLAHNLRAVVQQRLVRRLCDNCKVAAHPDAATLRQLATHSRVTIATLQKFMEETRKHGEQAQTMQLYKASEKGCAECRHTGFKGQIGLFELLPISTKIQKQLAAKADPLTIVHQAVKDGMMPLVVDGFIKALCGLTTLDEITRGHGD